MKLRKGLYGRINLRNGRAIKRYHGTLKREAVTEAVKKHEQYVSWLRANGVEVAETTVREIKRGKGFAIEAEQSEIPQKQFLNSIMKQSGEQARHAFQKLLEVTLSVSKANRGKTIKWGFDVAPRNFAIVNGRLIYVDTYPALSMQNGRVQPKPSRVHIRKRTLKPFARRFVLEDFGAGKLFSRILKYALALDPNQTGHYRETVQRFCEDNLTKEEFADFAKQTGKARMLWSRSMTKIINIVTR